MSNFDTTERKNERANKDYTVLRDAKEGDAGFNAAAGPQSWVRMPDGSEKCVAKNDVKG